MKSVDKNFKRIELKNWTSKHKPMNLYRGKVIIELTVDNTGKATLLLEDFDHWFDRVHSMRWDGDWITIAQVKAQQLFHFKQKKYESTK